MRIYFKFTVNVGLSPSLSIFDIEKSDPYYRYYVYVDHGLFLPKENVM